MTEAERDSLLTRRGFIAALAASVVAAGAPLPVGVPKPDATKPLRIFSQNGGEWRQVDVVFQVKVMFADRASEERARRECPALFAA